MSNFTLEEGRVIIDSQSGYHFTQKAGELFRSMDEGITWNRVAEAGRWSIAKAMNGSIHWVYPEWENVYPTSYRKTTPVR